MAARIARHQADRGQGWTTLEEPLEIARALAAEARPGGQSGGCRLPDPLAQQSHAGRRAIPRPPSRASPTRSAALAGPAILVSNEVGMGLVPDHKLGREFRDWQGRANREIAPLCDAVIFVAAGLPLQLKPAATPSVQLG